MSIIVSTTYPDPLESARCRRSPLPRRSLEPWDVVDDRCDPSVLLETRRDPLRKAPAKADSLRSGFGFDPVRNPNMLPGAKNGFWMLSLIAPPMRLCQTDEPTESSMPCVQADTSLGVEPRRLASPDVAPGALGHEAPDDFGGDFQLRSVGPSQFLCESDMCPQYNFAQPKGFRCGGE